MIELFRQFSYLLLESAPWLLLGLSIGGLMKALLPEQWLHRQMGANSFVAISKAALIGAPLPLCSCGVVPAALALRKSGASKGSTVSFLVATPETGPDSIALSYALLGPFMAVIRPVAAVASAIVSGLLVWRDDQPDTTDRHDSDVSQNPTKAASHCCSSHKHSPVEKTSSFAERAQSGLQFTFTRLLSDISLWLLIGLMAAAAIQTFVPLNWFEQWGHSFGAMLLMIVIGLPMYVCASASTPMAAGFLVAGFSPGAVLVFMLAGPATNIGTLGIIKQQLGWRSLSAYLGGVIGMALLFGGLVDWLVGQFSIPITVQSTEAHQHLTWWHWLSAIVLSAAIVRALWIDRFSKIVSRHNTPSTV